MTNLAKVAHPANCAGSSTFARFMDIVNNSYLIGLTGNLGSGKSTVRTMLEALGAHGIDADALAHTVMARGTPTWRAVVDAFSADILAFNGRIDRQRLAQRVFADADGLTKLEAIVHPAVGAAIKQMLRETDAPVIVVEAIKLIEAGLQVWCDALWIVKCAPEVQIARVMRDRHMGEADARARLASQSLLEDKLRFAHVIIDNSGNADATRAEVEQAWRTIQPATARDKSEWLGDNAPRAATSSAASASVSEPAPYTESLSAAATEVSLAPMPGWANDTSAAPQVQGLAKVKLEVEVRRARRSDLQALGVAIAKFEHRAQPLARDEALKRLGERGYRLAMADHRIVALAAWDAENLVATVREVWVESADLAPIALPKLLALIETEAKELLCEVVLLLIDESALTLTAEARALGYEEQTLPALHSAWQDVVRECLKASDQIWCKRLREGITTKPM